MADNVENQERLAERRAARDKKITDNALQKASDEIERQRDEAAAAATGFIRSKLYELSGLAACEFEFFHAPFGNSISCIPHYRNETKLQGFADEVTRLDWCISKAEIRMIEINEEVEAMATRLEDEFRRNLGRIQIGND